MANRWVEFVRKWARDNKMNYMCAMTTKECKDAYLKAYPKPIPGGLKGLYDGKKSAIDVEGLLDMIEGLLGDISNLGTDSWSGSTDNIIRLAKKHKVNISKLLSKEDAGWYQEYDTIENFLDAFKGKNYSKKIHFFLQDIFELLEGYRSKGEQIDMAEADVPAPAPAPKAKKVVIKVPKAPKKTKKSVMGETNTQPELVKAILDDMKKKGVKMDDTGDRTIIRKQKPDIKKVEDRLDAGEDIREELKGLVDLYDKELLGMKDSKKVEELVEKFNIKKRAEKAKKKGE